MTPNGTFDQLSSDPSPNFTWPQRDFYRESFCETTHGLSITVLEISVPTTFKNYSEQVTFVPPNSNPEQQNCPAGSLGSPGLFLPRPLQSVLSSHPWLGVHSAPSLPHLGLWVLHSSIHSPALAFISIKVIPKVHVGTSTDSQSLWPSASARPLSQLTLTGHCDFSAFLPTCQAYFLLPLCLFTLSAS